ncbi:MAG: hypothetical protein D6705_17825 [Deltaproteobacteria bacterium]|nr:MAG: hypothetical protein D6705_17825 [Deltaproteobacteria bacterium]
MSRARKDDRTGDLFEHFGVRDGGPAAPSHATPSLPEAVPATPCLGCGYLVVVGRDARCPQCGAPIPT